MCIRDSQKEYSSRHLELEPVAVCTLKPRGRLQELWGALGGGLKILVRKQNKMVQFFTAMAVPPLTWRPGLSSLYNI